MKRLNVIAVILFVGALVWVFTWDSPAITSFKARVIGLLSPFIRTGATVQDAVNDQSAPPPADPEALLRENVQMRRELDELKLYKQEFERIQQETNQLKLLLAYQTAQEYDLVPARILTRNAATWFRTAVVDRGWNNEITADAPVVTPQGVAGKIVSVSQDEAEVLFLTDESCWVAARVEGTTAQGILSGVRSPGTGVPQLVLRQLPKDSKIEPGARVYTAGVRGGVFSEGYLLGEITGFRALDLYGEATVKPSVDFNSLRYVFVIKRNQPAAAAPAPDTPKAAPSPPAARQ